MKDFIRKKLHEAIKELPYDPRAEMKAHSFSSLSDPNRRDAIKTLKYRIAKAADTAAKYRSMNPDDMYFSSAEDGDGFYQVEFRHDGNIRTKHIRPSGDIPQSGGKFQPSDVGFCKAFQNIAKYCFVRAGKNGTSVGTSPADDAANKALLIFRDELLDFVGDSGYDDERAAQISKEKMTDKEARHKVKKDIEAKLGRRLTDSEWETFLATGEEPKPKAVITADPEALSDFEKRQQAARDKIAAYKARIGKK